LLHSYQVVQQRQCQMKEFLIVLLMSQVMGSVCFMPFNISLLGQFLCTNNYVKQLLLVIKPNFDTLIVHSVQPDIQAYLIT
uniref:Uncharacterized protein n=1 Tax=Amphimedon queenslandica TaxID=400682 RepID=A0A1X7UA22_AMPQE